MSNLMSKYFPLINSINSSEREINAVYDLKIKEQISTSEGMQQIQNSVFVPYFHGTKECKAFSIMLNGFTYEDSEKGLLGSGVYFSDNIEKTRTFGDFIFVCALQTTENEHKINRTTFEKLSCNIAENEQKQNIEIIKYYGKYNRNNKINKTEEKFISETEEPTLFNETCVKNTDLIMPLYLIVLENVDATDFSMMQLSEMNIKCIIDVPNKTLHENNRDNLFFATSEKNMRITPNIHYIEMSLNDVFESIKNRLKTKTKLKKKQVNQASNTPYAFKSKYQAGVRFFQKNRFGFNSSDLLLDVVFVVVMRKGLEDY